MVPEDKKTKGFYSTVTDPTGILSGLVPFSKYKMFMVVANNHFESPPSNVVEFTTKEGGENHCSLLTRSHVAPNKNETELFIHTTFTNGRVLDGAGFKLATLYVQVL